VIASVIKNSGIGSGWSGKRAPPEHKQGEESVWTLKNLQRKKPPFQPIHQATLPLVTTKIEKMPHHSSLQLALRPDKVRRARNVLFKGQFHSSSLSGIADKDMMQADTQRRVFDG
jgi:hypothetical protein